MLKVTKQTEREIKLKTCRQKAYIASLTFRTKLLFDLPQSLSKFQLKTAVNGPIKRTIHAKIILRSNA
jgi:hypothetical protein